MTIFEAHIHEWRVALAREQLARFWAKVDRTGDCWLWTAGRSEFGYGKFAITCPRARKVKQIHVAAHRISFEMAHGPVDPSLVVMHACDTPACVNPAHLSAGTQAENRADCTAKGRNATGDRSGARLHPETRSRGDRHPSRLYPERLVRGEAAANAKLSEAQIRAIRASHAAGISCGKMAPVYGVNKATIIAIVARRSWKHVA